MSINAVSNQQTAVSGSTQTKGSADPTSEAGMFQLTPNANPGVKNSGITGAQLAAVANQLGLTDAQQFQLAQLANEWANGSITGAQLIQQVNQLGLTSAQKFELAQLVNQWAGGHIPVPVQA